MNVKGQDAVLNPDGFFADEADAPSLLAPSLIVVAVGLLEFARRTHMTNVSLSGTENAGMGGMVYLFSVPSLLTPVVSWLLVTVVLVVVAVYLGGEGSGGETLRVAGWGYVPALVGAVTTFGVTVYVLAMSPADGFAAQSAVRRTVESTGMRGFGYTLVAWQGFIWSFGVSHVHDLPLRKAAVSAAVAVALLLSWDLFGGEVVFRLAGVVF